MSNKPKIYAHCLAGCKWEVPHKSDVEEIATLLQEPINADGTFYCELGKEYKIFAPKNAAGNFNCLIQAWTMNYGGRAYYTIQHTNEDEYADSFMFRLLDMRVESASKVKIAYELAGTRYTEDITGANMSLLDKEYLCITGATKVYLHNNGVELIGINGKSAYEIAVEHGFKGTEEEWLETSRGPAGRGVKGIYQYVREDGTVEFRLYYTDDTYTTLNPEDVFNGKSAYEIAVAHGFEGTEEEWLESLSGGGSGGGADGKDGEDGFSPTISVSTITGGHRITITDKDGKKTVDVMDGVDGEDGKDGSNGTNGKDGRGIKSVARTSGNGGEGTTDTYTITYTDNTTSTFSVYNGKDGKDGTRGTGILKVSTSPTSYTTATAGINPIKRMSLATIKSEAGVSEVLVGDCIAHSYYLYHIYYIDATYAYMDKSQSIRGAAGTDYVLTDADKAEIAEQAAALVVASYPNASGVSF